MRDKNQGKLIDVENPLQERLGKAFFNDIPKVPGVYRMYSKSGQLLYVGKAKNLRTRLFSYRRARNDNVSVKVRRLIRMIYRIDYECCVTEEEALLKENKLIREQKPGFNVAKKKPNTYYYLRVIPTDSGLSFRLSMELEEKEDGGYVYGAFKGHRTVRQGTGALLRQLYLLENELTSVFGFPGTLLRNLTPLRYDLKFRERGFLTEETIDKLHHFLLGSSSELMSTLVLSVAERDLLQDFMGRLILKDFESLKQFHVYCARRNHELVETLQLPSHLIPQQKLDDYLVQAAFVR